MFCVFWIEWAHTHTRKHLPTSIECVFASLSLLCHKQTSSRTRFTCWSEHILGGFPTCWRVYLDVVLALSFHFFAFLRKWNRSTWIYPREYRYLSKYVKRVPFALFPEPLNLHWSNDNKLNLLTIAVSVDHFLDAACVSSWRWSHPSPDWCNARER